MVRSCYFDETQMTMNKIIKCAALFIGVVLFGVSCGKTEKCQNLSIGELRQMQSFTAKVEVARVAPSLQTTNNWVVVVLRTEDAKCRMIDKMHGSTRLVQFAKSLKEGDKYEFPKTLLSFEALHGPVDK